MTTPSETVRHAPPPDRAVAPPGEVTVPRWLRGAGAASWRLLAVGALAVAVLYLLSLLRVVVLPVIVAILASTLLHGPAEALRRRGLPPAAAVAAVMAGTALLLVAIIAAIAPSIGS